MVKKRSKKQLNLILIGVLLILIDQLVKYLAISNLTFHQPIAVIKNFFYLTLTTNTGVGFGLLKNTNTLLIFLTIMIIGGVLYFYEYLPKSKNAQLAITLILAGAFSNLIDRIFRNHIIDFLDFRVWPIFNIADICITLGAIYLMIYYLKKK
ncbi:signal peptidase II [Candidatus Woesearchaeota archaeon]|nr:signal peptidase II [Candidatus Woesearchaeota archaeon]MBL7051316.1 signal peptidase II [Candidatus Woesearchaeota archaeon]